MTQRLAALLVAALALVSSPAAAFPHIARAGETLASIASRVYGTSKMEPVLAGINGLDAQGGSAVVAGMRLELPAPWHHRVVAGETWASLARAYLGDAERADVLARHNSATAWIAPAAGAEVRVPYVMTAIAAPGEKSTDIARRLLGDGRRAWEIHTFNGLTKGDLVRGQVVLVPLLDLTLTDAGREEALAAMGLERSAAGGAALEAQRKVAAELPELLAAVRTGRWTEAIAQGNRMLAAVDLSRAQLATIQRALTEAYVAVGASGLATAACAAWRQNDPGAAALDPVAVSPKIRAVCK